MDQQTIPTKVVNDIATLKRLGWNHEKILIHMLKTQADYGVKLTSDILNPLITPPKPKPVRKPKPSPPKKREKLPKGVNIWHLPEDWKPALLGAVRNLGAEHLIEEDDDVVDIVCQVVEGLMDGLTVTEDDVEQMLIVEVKAARSR